MKDVLKALEGPLYAAIVATVVITMILVIGPCEREKARKGHCTTFPNGTIACTGSACEQCKAAVVPAR